MNRSHGYSRKEPTAVSSRATPPTPCVRRHRLHGRGIVRGNVWERTGGDAHACRLSAFAQAPFTHAVDHGAPVPSRWDEADHPVAWRARSAPCPPGRFITVLRCFSNGCLPRIFVNRSAGFSSPGMCRTVTRPAPRSSLILKMVVVGVRPPDLCGGAKNCWYRQSLWPSTCPRGTTTKHNGSTDMHMSAARSRNPAHGRSPLLAPLCSHRDFRRWSETEIHCRLHSRQSEQFPLI